MSRLRLYVGTSRLENAVMTTALVLAGGFCLGAFVLYPTPGALRRWLRRKVTAHYAIKADRRALDGLAKIATTSRVGQR